MNNPPAFPTQNSTLPNGDFQWGDPVMDLRDWFAGQEALAEWDNPVTSISELMATQLAGPKPDGGWSKNPLEMFKWEAKWRAALKYIRADAMLAEREKVKP